MNWSGVLWEKGGLVWYGKGMDNLAMHWVWLEKHWCIGLDVGEGDCSRREHIVDREGH